MSHAEEVLHRVVLELLRSGHEVDDVAVALASEKVRLMQSHEYADALREARLRRN